MKLYDKVIVKSKNTIGDIIDISNDGEHFTVEASDRDKDTDEYPTFYCTAHDCELIGGTGGSRAGGGDP